MRIVEGYTLGEEQILQQFHAFMDILWESDYSIVCYPFPGHIAHSLHIVPYSQHHVLKRKKIEEAIQQSRTSTLLQQMQSQHI